MKRVTFCLTLCAIGIIAIHARAQNPARDATAQPTRPGTAMIAGIVINADATATPLRRVRLTLASTEHSSFSRTTASDDRGHFEFRSLPAGRYSLQATKAAWLTASYGATRPNRPGSSIPLADGQQITSITLPMWRGAVITGRIRFQDGSPAPGLTVMALRSVVRDGEPAFASSPTTLTDDRGEYRLFGLPPGDVLVFATVSFQGRFNTSEIRQIESGEIERALQEVRQRGNRPGSTVSATRAPSAITVDYAPVFYPGTADPATATVSTIAAGAELTGIDFVLPLIRTSRVEGTVTTVNGGPVPLTTLLLTSTGPAFAVGASVNGIARGTTDKDGRYHFYGTAPGTYSLAAASSTTGTSAAAELSTEVSVTVNGQDLDVPLTLRPSGSITGRVVFEGGAPPSAAGLRIAVRAFGPLASLIARSFGSEIANGEFLLPHQIVPGKYRLTVAGLPTDRWFIKSSFARGQETMDVPLEIPQGTDVNDWVITYTDRPTEYAGTLQDLAGRPAPDYFIIAFPTERTKWARASWRFKYARPSLDGSFSIKGLPAGEYFVAALTDVDPGDWSSPEFLAQIPIANTVTITLVDAQRAIGNFRIPRSGKH